MELKRTYEDIRKRVAAGDVVVLTAEEVKKLGQEQGVKQVLKEVDIVTTGTFGPMCSSGAFLNFGHSSPPINMKKIWLNDVPTYAGVAAVDAYIGATEGSEISPDKYGGAHVIEDLIAGKDIKLKALGKGTDCYPRKDIETFINKKSVNEAFLFNPRNAYQNYAAATNTSDRTLRTYMGTLLPNCANATYSTSGELSPLLNDPELKTVGIGTRIFLGGTQGYVAWNGTQFNTSREKNASGIPTGPGATLAVVGDLKKMSTDFIRAAVFDSYGISMFVGIGLPIPVLDMDIAKRVCVLDHEIETNLCDYSDPSHPAIGRYNYAQLKSGEIDLKGRSVRTGPLSSMYKARVIAKTLKDWIKKGEFGITRPVEGLPKDTKLNSLEVRGVGK